MRPPLKYNLLHFTDGFAELRKATIPGSFIMSVRQAVRMKQLSSHWTDFHVI